MNDAGQPISCIRSFPHIVDELKNLTITEFIADMQTGMLAGSAEGL